MNAIGLRKEEKAFESRVPVVPDHVKKMIEEQGIRFVIESSQQRAFSHDEYLAVGAKIGDLSSPDVRVILGIKEMPLDFFQKDKVYIFFSHTIKGQSQNMPMLQKMIDTGCTLIDYERIVDDNNRRLIFFGNWAGLAGMSDTLRVLGERLTHEGIEPNPFHGMKPTLECNGLDELKEEFRRLGQRIEEHGLPDELTPFVIGFAGYGNVSRGAQEMFDILPHETVKPDQLGNLQPLRNTLYKCVFMESHMVRPIDSSDSFDLQDYYQHGTSKYIGVFQEYIPHLTVLMNCIYWSSKYPRLVSKDYLKQHWSDPKRRLRVVGDISCDIQGAIEFTVKCTDAGEPAFTYSVIDDAPVEGVNADGPVIMAVDNLPCELPRESSTSFSSTLLKFIPNLASADFGVPFDELDLRREIKDAVIVYQGSLTERYEYLSQYLQEG